MKLSFVRLYLRAASASMPRFLAIAASLWCFLARLVARILATIITVWVFQPGFLYFGTLCPVVSFDVTLTASYGGKHDWLIVEHGLKHAKVVYSEEEAEAQQMEIDHDDYHAAFGKENFALLIHGTQPKGSMASQALQELKRRGWNGYSKRQQLATA